MMIKMRVLLFALFPVLLAAYSIWVKISDHGVSYKPEINVKTFQVEAHIKAQGSGKFSRLELELPVVLDRHQIVSENFVSNGFAVAILNAGDVRKAVWSGLASNKSYDFYYRAIVNKAPDLRISRKVPETLPYELTAQESSLARALIRQVKTKRATGFELIKQLSQEIVKGDSKQALELRQLESKNRRLIDTVAATLSEAGFLVRKVRAIKLAGAERGSRFTSVLEVFLEDSWYAIDYRNGQKLSDQWFVWRRSGEPFLVTRNLDAATASVSITPEHASLSRPNVPDSIKEQFPSVQSLPIEAQALYSIILVIPVGALLVAFIRSIIGIKTLGTFMPVLIALSFRETELFWGLSLYLTIIILSLVFRYFFEHLQLLVVPRLTATMTLVVIVIFLFSCLMDYLEVNRALSVALFPIVILTMMIERISIIWEELGLWKATIQTMISLFVASLIYLIISNEYVQYYMLVFPELLLVILSIAILLGRFTGYRLTELYRFRTFLRAN